MKNTRKKIDLSITPLRLTAVIVGLSLAGLNEFFSWDISQIGFISIMLIFASVFFTQPKE